MVTVSETSVVDLANIQAISLLETLGHFKPSQVQIDLMEQLIKMAQCTVEQWLLYQAVTRPICH